MSNRSVVNTPATAKDALPATSGPDAAAATSEWFKRAGYYAAQAVANAERAHRRTVERRLDKPSRTWTGSEVIRSYRTNAKGERRFRDEAEVFTPNGYRPWLDTNSVGNRRGGLVLIAATGAALLNESERRGNRRVSWVKDASLSDAPIAGQQDRQGAEEETSCSNADLAQGDLDPRDLESPDPRVARRSEGSRYRRHWRHRIRPPRPRLAHEPVSVQHPHLWPQWPAMDSF